MYVFGVCLRQISNRTAASHSVIQLGIQPKTQQQTATQYPRVFGFVIFFPCCPFVFCELFPPPCVLCLLLSSSSSSCARCLCVYVRVQVPLWHLVIFLLFWNSFISISDNLTVGLLKFTLGIIYKYKQMGWRLTKHTYHPLHPQATRAFVHKPKIINKSVCVPFDRPLLTLFIPSFPAVVVVVAVVVLLTFCSWLVFFIKFWFICLFLVFFYIFACPAFFNTKQTNGMSRRKNCINGML